MRNLYAGRQFALLQGLDRHLAHFSDAGMHLVGWLPEGVAGWSWDTRRRAKRRWTRPSGDLARAILD